MDLFNSVGLRFIQSKFYFLSKVSKRKAAQKAFELFITPQTRVKKPLPQAFAGAEKLSFYFENHLIAGYRVNPGSAKRVLILHGYESSVLNFDAYVKPLVEKGYQVLGFDAPAHGASGGKTLNAIDYKNFVLQLIKSYGPVTSFITHSFGGLALSLALEDVPHDETWKVVFIAPATESVTAIDNFFGFLKLDAGVRKEFDHLISAANSHSAEWYSVSRAIENIKAQVLFLQDKNDTLTPLSDVEPIMARRYPNFTFIISEGLGHSRIYRDEGSINAIIRFL